MAWYDSSMTGRGLKESLFQSQRQINNNVSGSHATM